MIGITTKIQSVVAGHISHLSQKKIRQNSSTTADHQRDGQTHKGKNNNLIDGGNIIGNLNAAPLFYLFI